jgi:hypothetical protein
VPPTFFVNDINSDVSLEKRQRIFLILATSCKLYSPGIETQWGRYFQQLCRMALEPKPPPVQWVRSLYYWVKAAGACCWPPSLIQRWSQKKSRAISLLPQCSFVSCSLKCTNSWYCQKFYSRIISRHLLTQLGDGFEMLLNSLYFHSSHTFFKIFPLFNHTLLSEIVNLLETFLEVSESLFRIFVALLMMPLASQMRRPFITDFRLEGKKISWTQVRRMWEKLHCCQIAFW